MTLTYQQRAESRLYVHTDVDVFENLQHFFYVGHLSTVSRMKIEFLEKRLNIKRVSLTLSCVQVTICYMTIYYHHHSESSFWVLELP